MSITLDVKAILIALMIIAIIVLVVYLIVLVSRLVKTVEHTNSILANVDKISGDAKDTVEVISGALKDNQGFVATVKGVVAVIPAIKAIVDKATKSDKKGDTV